MNISITARLYQIPETGQIGGEQMQNTHGYHGNVPFAHSHQNVMTANGYVPYQEGNQNYPNDNSSNDNFALQNSRNVLNPYAPYPVFHNPYAHTTFVQNHIYQPQTNRESFYNPIQHASVSCAPRNEIHDGKSTTWSGAALSSAPPKRRVSDSNKEAPSHHKIGQLQKGNFMKQTSTANFPKQANKYRCSSCKQITEKVILKKKGPNNWLCVRCYNRCYNFTGYQKYLFDKMVRNAPAS